MTSTIDLKTEFLNNFQLPKIENHLSIVENYIDTRNESMIQSAEVGVGEAGKKEVKKKLAQAFINRWMRTQFAELCLDFTKRDWWIKIKRVNNIDAEIVESYDREPKHNIDRVMSAIVKVPRFFTKTRKAGNFAFDNEEEYEYESRSTRSNIVSFERLGQLSSGKRGDIHYRHVDITISANLPDGVKTKHRIMAQHAISHLELGKAILFKKGVWLAAESDLEHDHFGTISIIWGPNLEHLSVTLEPARQSIDPAIVYNICDKSYLLDFYDTPDEKPIEHLIREFSEGKLNK